MNISWLHMWGDYSYISISSRLLLKPDLNKLTWAVIHALYAVAWNNIFHHLGLDFPRIKHMYCVTDPHFPVNERYLSCDIPPLLSQSTVQYVCRHYAVNFSESLSQDIWGHCRGEWIGYKTANEGAVVSNVLYYKRISLFSTHLIHSEIILLYSSFFLLWSFQT